MKKRFSNPPGTIPQRINPITLLKWLWQLATSSGKEGLPEDHLVPSEEAMGMFKRAENYDSITWIGHSTFLVWIGETKILTDPFFSHRASPSQFMGPKRMFPPGLTPETIGTPDIVLVSHNHYDHLDDNAVRSLKNKDKITVIVPKGLKRFFLKRGYSKVYELVWEEKRTIESVNIQATPAIHFSARGFFDRNKTLWCGYIIEIDGRKIYFSGDTAYHSIFKDFGKSVGPIDIAMVPIGAYEPALAMRPVHTDPEEAVQLGKDLQASSLVGIHWGTIRLTIEPPEEPPKRFKIAGKSAGYSEDDVWVMKIGETREIAW